MLFALLLNLCMLVNTLDMIHLNTSNLITVKGPITDDLATQFVYEINQKQEKNDLYVFIDTNGGSVDAGNQIVEEIEKYELSCIAARAISMGFIILQSCNKRYITKYGFLMQHQMSYGVTGEKEHIDSYVKFVNGISDTLQQIQADKIGMSREEFRQKTLNDWWLFGEDAVTQNCVDEVVKVACSSELTNQTYTEENGSYTYTYSKCPLVKNHVKKKKNNNVNIEDFFYFV